METIATGKKIKKKTTYERKETQVPQFKWIME